MMTNEKPVYDIGKLLTKIESNYRSRTSKSRAMYKVARSLMPGGLSHNARFFTPYPFFEKRARGQHLWDIDGNRYTDYWMGHTALILGHSSAVVRAELRRQIPNGLLPGTANENSLGLARLVSEIVPCAEGVRFCTTGAEATMYAVRLARAFTRRNQIIKMAGGWHGFNSSLTYGVQAPFEGTESAGLIPEEKERVKLAPFNKIHETTNLVMENAKDLAGVIIEPVMGGGVLPANKDYLQTLRKLCSETGAVLIFDEVITGFRLALGGAQEYYGIKPDLCTLGKIMGGGLPASAIVGKKEIMALADPTVNRPKDERAWIGGGTFSEHALAMSAGRVTLEYLKKNRKAVYGRLEREGDEVRRSLNQEFEKRGIRSSTTGTASLFGTHFLSENQEGISTQEDLVESRRELELPYFLYLMAMKGIFILPGHISAISSAHTKFDISQLAKASGDFADYLKEIQ
jgi:glutamate-1-semialdehyde 2,1-aminomutase